MVYESCSINTICYCFTSLRESDISWRRPFVFPIHICPTLLTSLYPTLKLIDQTLHDLCWNLTAIKCYSCAYSLDSIVQIACKKTKYSPSALLTYQWSSLHPLVISVWPVWCSDIFFPSSLSKSPVSECGLWCIQGSFNEPFSSPLSNHEPTVRALVAKCSMIGLMATVFYCVQILSLPL